jgi:hypothetical protein
MLSIRPVQMKVFEAVALRKFEDDMVIHLAAYAPEHCKAIGEPAVRTSIRLGLERAANYGFTNRGPVRFYIEAMFMFGSDFDTDPQYAWAGTILKDPTITDQMARAARLAGPDYAYAKSALIQLRRVPFEALPLHGDRFATQMFARLKEIYPQKIAYLGETRTYSFIDYARLLPGKLGVDPTRGAALCVGAAFALGHGFGSDPLLPWIVRTVKNPNIIDATARAQRMHARMMTYLDAVLTKQTVEAEA